MDKVDVVVQLLLWSKCGLWRQVRAHGSHCLREPMLLWTNTDFGWAPDTVRSCTVRSIERLFLEWLCNRIHDSTNWGECFNIPKLRWRIEMWPGTCWFYHPNLENRNYPSASKPVVLRIRAHSVLVFTRAKITRSRSYLMQIRLIIKWCDSTSPGESCSNKNRVKYAKTEVWRRARPQRRHVCETSAHRCIRDEHDGWWQLLLQSGIVQPNLGATLTHSFKYLSLQIVCDEVFLSVVFTGRILIYSFARTNIQRSFTVWRKM